MRSTRTPIRTVGARPHSAFMPAGRQTKRMTALSVLAATPERSILWACNEGRADLVANLLLQNSALVHATDPDGYTPLHRASYNNNVPLVKLLLAHGADPNAVTEFGWTPVHSACQWTHAECVAVLLQHGADVNARTDGGGLAHIQADRSKLRD